MGRDADRVRGIPEFHGGRSTEGRRGGTALHLPAGMLTGYLQERRRVAEAASK
jgi:hypothetical protein